MGDPVAWLMVALPVLFVVALLVRRGMDRG